MSFIEVCAGCGGLSSGFINAGFKPLLLNDIDKTCCKTLSDNHKNVNINSESMLDLDLRSYKNKVDALIGGVSCQSFSSIGKRKGLKDERGELIMEFRRLIDETNPKIFLIENVKGLLTHNNGKTLDKVLKNLPNNKYDIQYNVLNAVNYEVPQKRERIFIVGIRKDLNKKFEFPKEINKKIVLKDVLKSCPKSKGYTYSDTKRKLMDKIPQGGCWVDLPTKIAKRYMGASFNSGGGQRGVLKRLSMNEPSLTLTTSPSQKQTERCHPTETRPLTIREYARIQTFPDNYNFNGSIAAQYKQIGNAVPVKLAYHIAKALHKLIIQ